MINNNKQPNVYVPTREEFDEFCARGMKLDDKEWIDAIWNLVSKAGWKKKNGEAPNHWHSLVSAYNGLAGFIRPTCLLLGNLHDVKLYIVPTPRINHSADTSGKAVNIFSTILAAKVLSPLN